MGILVIPVRLIRNFSHIYWLSFGSFGKTGRLGKSLRIMRFD